MYTATLNPNVLPGVRSRGEGDESSRTMKINANIQLGGMKEGERNEERNVAEYWSVHVPDDSEGTISPRCCI